MTQPDLDELARGLREFAAGFVRSTRADSLSRTASSTLSWLVREGATRITTLADREAVTQPAMTGLVQRLELAGLVTTEKVGRVRTCRIGPCRLEEEMEWITRYRQVWDERFEALDGVIDELKRQEKARGRKKRK